MILPLFLSLFSLSAAQAWTLNDVSVLLPLPARDEIPLLLSTQSRGDRGELLPFEVYQNLPRIVVGADPQVVYQEDLRVIGIRIDPCFTERGAPEGCRHQIRLVWQPVIASGKKSITVDAAMHSFYDLSETDWQSLLNRLRPLAGNAPDEGLDVHPRIRQQGLSGQHWAELKKIVLDFAGAKNLTRVTAMSVDPFGTIWTFSGVDIKNSLMTRIQIPRAKHVVQAFSIDLSNLSEFRTSLRPSPENAVPWMNLISHSQRALRESPESEIREALRQSLRIENPLLEDTASMDCVSCHIAQNVRLWGERHGFSTDWKKDFAADVFVKPEVNLENPSRPPGFINRLRAFGYFIDEVSLSQRLIHESAEVLSVIRKQDCEAKLFLKNEAAGSRASKKSAADRSYTQRPSRR